MEGIKNDQEIQQQCGPHKSGLDSVVFTQELKLTLSLPNMAPLSKPARVWAFAASGYPGLSHTDVPSTASQPAHQHTDQEVILDQGDFDLRKDSPRLGAFLVLFEAKKSSVVGRTHFAVDFNDV